MYRQAVTDFSQARETFLNSLESDQAIFADTIAFIDHWYVHTPTAFRNGPVYNGADQNQGSCKVLALAALLKLDRLQTLRCFGEHYRDVEANPNGESHRNLRRLYRDGLVDIEFECFPLVVRKRS